MRWDALSIYGQKAISTPNIDSIAHEGIKFEKAYSSVPVCTPARAILLTSLKPWNNGQLAYGEVGLSYK